ncbi:pilus assembly protein [Rhizobium sp. BK176]|uniref:pilus assembly protein n=1 Tax=Rhizobium sp. BK176 TaxID=2587071 RepID=UPI0021681004|nr:pilus assembly protein [Rhizobium sp. BK176]MCS4089473.1 type II secretory pathway component GspD/PulD (secretin) [Rhizobium sp. BK176]
MKFTKILLAVLAASTATGCVNQRAANDIRSTSAESSNLLSEAKAPLPAAQKNVINTHGDVFVGTKSVVNEHGEPLPQRVEKANGVTISKGNASISLKEVASIITTETKIPVVVAANVPVAASTGGAAAQPQAVAPELAAGPVPAGFPIDQALQQISNSAAPASIVASAGPVQGTMSLNFHGRLSDLLDLVASNFNVSWKYERGKIVIDSTVTRSFDVPALPMVTSLGFALGELGENKGGANAKTDVTVNVFEELTTALGKLVGDSYSINRSTGVVTVTGSPAVVDRARDYIDNLNLRLKDQVALSVKVYSVTVKDNEDFALNIGGVFKSAKDSITLGGSGTAGAISGGGSLGWALVDAASQYNGSNAAVKALSERGDVSVVTTASLTTVNGQPVPLQVGQDRDYIKQITVEKDTDAGTEDTTFETDTVSTGFALQLMPRIQRNGDVLLQYGVNIKELVGTDDGFDERKIGDNTVQLKRLNQRNFIQNANIPYGQTLVLAGFEQVRSSTQNSGTGHPLFSLLGGSASASKEREVIVIMITPTVLK